MRFKALHLNKGFNESVMKFVNVTEKDEEHFHNAGL